jgi:hypothetical protein
MVRWRAALAAAGMACVIETGGRHLLDPFQKHEPTLVTADREARNRRTDLLCRAIDIATDLGATCVSLWSGVVRDSADEASIWSRLTGSLAPVLDHAAARQMPLGFEPEPGMAIDTLARYSQLLDRLGRPDHLRLTIDIGHMECMGEWPMAGVLRPWADRVVNVHVDDMLVAGENHGFAPYEAKLKNRFKFRTWKTLSATQSLEYCGAKLHKNAKGIDLSFSEYLSKLKPITVDVKTNSGRRATPAEVRQLRGLLGALQWPSTQGCPHLSCSVSME